MFFLCLETATTVCSVALFENERQLALREINEGFSHAENLHVFVQEVLLEANCMPNQLSAIAVSVGPGSYTGLRIGVSTAKGLAYALNIPVIAIDTLQIIAAGTKAEQSSAFYVPMIDARRMEVYTAVYDAQLNEIEKVEALIVDEQSVQKYSKYEKICFSGDGMPKCKDLLTALAGTITFSNILPNAKYMGALALDSYDKQLFEDVAYFEPRYLKEFQAGKKKTAI